VVAAHDRGNAQHQDAPGSGVATQVQRKNSQVSRDTARRSGSAESNDHLTSLENVSLFAGLDAEGLRELAAAVKRRAFRPGEVIFHRDDAGQVLYVIQSGKVKIYITSQDGQEVSLAVFGPGDYFGELALLDGQPRSASAIAIEPVETFALQRTDFINAVMHHPRIAIQVMNVLSRRLRQTDAMIEDLLFLDVHGRVAKKLLELAELHGLRTPEGIRIDLRLTQGELAAMVGASRESVNKVMGYFTDKRFISTDKYKITIIRLAELRLRVY
jgi:CRP/FNR family transcriptional regulator/CRP/FNR family cyclic AMP-dependent transcriptional regulator